MWYILHTCSILLLFMVTFYFKNNKQHNAYTPTLEIKQWRFNILIKCMHDLLPVFLSFFALNIYLHSHPFICTQKWCWQPYGIVGIVTQVHVFAFQTLVVFLKYNQWWTCTRGYETYQFYSHYSYLILQVRHLDRWIIWLLQVI